MEVGKSEISPSLDRMLTMLSKKGEYLAFVPDANGTRFMLDVLSLKFPLLKVPSFVLRSLLFSKKYACFKLCREINSVGFTEHP